MKNRITNYLQNKTIPKNDMTKKLIDLLHEELEKRGVTVDEIISDFNILTIDALNQQIINSIPLLTQYGYQSVIIEDAASIHSEIIKEIIYAEKNSESIHKILFILNIEFPQLENYFLELLTNRDKWIHYIFDYESSNEFDRYIKQEEEKCLTHLQKVFNLNDSIHSKKKESGFTDLNNYLNIKYSHILVDEFQDTNNNQLQLFKYLTHGWGPENTFFCVGDPMQSIYRFRQSDVRIFLDTIKNGIGNVKLNHIILIK